MTRCESIEDLLPLHATGDTTVEEGLRVEEHLAACAGCRADGELYAAMTAVARTELAHVPSAPEVAGAAEAASPVRRFHGRGLALGYGRLAAAAALLTIGLAAGAAVGRWSAGSPAASPDAGTPGGALPAGVVQVRSLPLSVFSPHARARLSRVARVEDSKSP
jgi:predicted anti-sigma-YlaC factor YlaD